MITGEQRQEVVTKDKNKKFVGLTPVEVVAINPTRSELNKLLGREDADTDKEIIYKTEDAEGNDKIKMTFWFYVPAIDKYQSYSFSMVNKVRVSKDGLKTQFVNSTCMTAWADTKENLGKWFTTFTDRENVELGDKVIREALQGEEELVTLLHSWLGRLNFYNAATSVLVDTKKLFNEDYSELRDIVGGNYDTPFIALFGVQTDESDPEKQYQMVYGKSFLSEAYMDGITKGMKFSKEYMRKGWDRFEKEVEGEYGFRAFFELKAIKEYDRSLDVTAQLDAGITPVNSKY